MGNHRKIKDFLMMFLYFAIFPEKQVGVGRFSPPPSAAPSSPPSLRLDLLLLLILLMAHELVSAKVSGKVPGKGFQKGSGIPEVSGILCRPMWTFHLTMRGQLTFHGTFNT